MKIILLRHGLTEGNITKKFIGVTDDPLCAEGLSKLHVKREVYITDFIAKCNLIELFVSPMTRCIQSAEALFPKMEFTVVEDLRECDFGILEGKNHEDLSENKEYLEFVNNPTADCFPGGENIEGFLGRCASSFKVCLLKYLDVLNEIDSDDALVFVVHGGTIMGIMDRFANSDESIPYYKWNVDNGCGYIAELKLDENGEMFLDDIKGIN